MKKAKSYLIALFLLSLISCFDSGKRVVILDKNVDELFEMAHHQQKILCLFLGGGEQCNNCKNTIAALQSKKVLKDFEKNYLFGSCNAGDSINIYLHYCLMMTSLPTMYLFSSEGELLAYLSDLSNAEVVRVLLESTIGGDPYPKSKHAEFKSGFGELMKMQNYVLDGYAEYRLANSHDTMHLQHALEHVKLSTEIEPYFFNLFLYSKINEQLGRDSIANVYAYQALKACKDGFQQAVYALQIRELKEKCMKFQKEEEQKPYLSLNTNILELGKLSYKSNKEYILEFINKGKQPLLISNVSSTCGCISTEWSKQPILPDKQGKIKLVFSADKKGKFQRTIFVISNASNQLEQLILKGSVV